jgi:exodeoxyribonuclease VIII
MQSDLKHVMVDLETLGTIPGCVGLSIGAVVMDFDKMELAEEFYTVVSTPDSLESFLHVDPNTVKWWNDKSPDARRVLEDAKALDAPSLAQAMSAFNDWLLGVGASVRKCRLYGNGADFDNPILRVMWDAAKVEPFHAKPGAGFFGGRCYRTLKSLDELFGPAFAAPKLEREGTYHHALDDAKHQARHLMSIVRHVRGAAKVPSDI